MQLLISVVVQITHPLQILLFLHLQSDLRQFNAVGEVTVSTAGTVNGIRFTNAGFGYTQVPTFVIDTPSQKRTATGKVSYDTSGVGTITAVEVIDPGFGYTVAPTVTFSDPSGSSVLALAQQELVSEVLSTPLQLDILVPVMRSPLQLY